MAPASRRNFLKSSVLAALPSAAAAAPLAAPVTSPYGTQSTRPGATAAAPAALQSASQPPLPAPAGIAPADAHSAALHWLEGGAPDLAMGTTVGIPWPRGVHKDGQTFVLTGDGGVEIPMQSWPLAWWPDGSLKWTAHALPAGASAGAQPGMVSGLPSYLALGPGTPRAPAAHIVTVSDYGAGIEIDTGVIRCTIARQGRDLVKAVTRNGRATLTAGRLVVLADDGPAAEAASVTQTRYESVVQDVTVEQSGPVRAVVRVTGRHRANAGNAAGGAGVGDGRAWLPFTVRLYFHAGGDAVRIMHTFVFDGDENRDYLRGIGLRFAVPMADALHDRHVRFCGDADGIWGEGVRNLTGLRRDPGAGFRAAQVAGQACPPLEGMNPLVRKLMHLVPAWGDYTLSQLSADGFQVRKRTKPGHGWIDASWGRRAPGCGYIGGASGGAAFGLRDFWQRHPTQLDIRNAHTDTAEVTLWMWSPDAPPMDIRFYHDGMGMETHAQELDGLEITYEDYEKGFGSPYGVARSSEITLWALDSTPARAQLARMASHVRTPPQLVAQPAHYLACGIFGGLWNLPDRAHPAKAAIEDELDRRFAFYKEQVEQQHWYGFWNYGDVMHTYDADRHVWRYDVGGFAWDNSELSPDLWLWYSFLRSGRADIFRFAEAMVRHTSEVDMHHLGRFAGLGSRHNVQHWGCSAKQVRISAAVYRRFYYYLTGDERIGDIMRELLDADAKLAEVDPVRKRAEEPEKGGYPARISFGTDWGSLAGNWLAEWERRGTQAQRSRDKLLTGMRDIAGLPKGFFSASRAGYEPATGHLHDTIHGGVSASHLNAVFGAVEIFAELIDLTGDRGFERAWLQYCRLYNAAKDEQKRELGAPHGGTAALTIGHSRLTAYAAWRTGDATLARRAWKEFHGKTADSRPVRIGGAAVMNPGEEIANASTNDTAQWCLAAIQNLALVGDHIGAA